MNSSSFRPLALTLAVFTAGATLVAACSGDDSNVTAPPTKTTNQPDSSVTTPGNGTDSGVDAGTDTGTVTTASTCFSGTPTTNAEFMNACTDAASVVIDNCARIGLCDGGTLPALNPPPDDAGPGDSGSDSGNLDAGSAVDSGGVDSGSADASPE